MAGLSQNPFQYAQRKLRLSTSGIPDDLHLEPRSQQQLQYQQVAMAAQQQQHYPFYK